MLPTLSNDTLNQLWTQRSLRSLMAEAAEIRDLHYCNVITYSKKVFIPLTQLCRDVCHYCTFAKVPSKLKSPYLTVDEVLKIARQGQNLGCKEALFTLGEKPELRYKVAKEWLNTHGYESTIDYLNDVAARVLEETSLLPHFNPGTLSEDEIRTLRSKAPSMGLMLESSATRLTKKGMPHYGSPDKDPKIRLQTLNWLGQNRVPTTTGILMGIGETLEERLRSLWDIHEVHQQYHHIQEVIVQPFRAKSDTQMANFSEPSLEEILRTIAIARLLFKPEVSIQAPPNLSPGVLPHLIDAGINDWGGVSPLTPDFVNPEAPWPHLKKLKYETASRGKLLHERLTVYPKYIQDPEIWIDPAIRPRVLRAMDADGLPRADDWCPGDLTEPPYTGRLNVERPTSTRSNQVSATLDHVLNGKELDLDQIVQLFSARGDDFVQVVQFANALRKTTVGDTVTYVVNRNINYTNICYFKCRFCAFSKGKLSENLRGRPYDLDKTEIQRRVIEAWDRGATEVCMQGGIHPDYTGDKYIELVRLVKEVTPEMHVHAFSPLEIWQGALSSKRSLEDFLKELKTAGLNTLPGTAAEILDDSVRKKICPDKINSKQWLEVVSTAHKVGIPTTATIMFGHVERSVHWARHLLAILEVQKNTGGFTEFVPLPFIHQEAPMYRKGSARKGPTFRECLLMYAVARIVLHPYIKNIQASWVKLGPRGAISALNSGCNDLGGTLMNESISRAAGTLHGQETNTTEFQKLICSIDRVPLQRSTLYAEISPEIRRKSDNPHPLKTVSYSPPSGGVGTRCRDLVRN